MAIWWLQKPAAYWWRPNIHSSAETLYSHKHFVVDAALVASLQAIWLSTEKENAGIYYKNTGWKQLYCSRRADTATRVDHKSNLIEMQQRLQFYCTLYFRLENEMQIPRRKNSPRPRMDEIKIKGRWCGTTGAQNWARNKTDELLRIQWINVWLIKVSHIAAGCWVWVINMQAVY